MGRSWREKNSKARRPLRPVITIAAWFVQFRTFSPIKVASHREASKCKAESQSLESFNQHQTGLVKRQGPIHCNSPIKFDTTSDQPLTLPSFLSQYCVVFRIPRMLFFLYAYKFYPFGTSECTLFGSHFFNKVVARFYCRQDPALKVCQIQQSNKLAMQKNQKTYDKHM